jgi:hypothetical protein
VTQGGCASIPVPTLCDKGQASRGRMDGKDGKML